VSEAYKNSSKEDLIRENIQLKTDLSQIRQELAELKRLIFGSRSERFVAQPLAGQLKLDLDTDAVQEPQATTQEVISRVSKKKKPVRQKLPEHLPRTEIVIEPEADTTGLKRIGEEVTEYLGKHRATTFVIRIIRPKYAQADEEGILIGKLPSRAIEKSNADESLLADILVSKYVDHLPLYRQAQIFARQGVPIASSTMSDWVGACCKLLEPLYQALKKEVFLNEYIQADESPIRVLSKSGSVKDKKRSAKKGKAHQGYQWVYHAKDPKLVLFDYRKGRGRDGPKEMLQKFKGYLQTDGYGVYDAFEKNPSVTLIGCMAHARRYFVKAQDNDPVRAKYFLQQVQLLYELERTLRDKNASWDDRYTVRQRLARPILESLGQWLKAQSQEVLPKSAIGKAVHYSLHRWNKLCGYTKHGGLEIDNNLIENLIRPLALGRKNYLFAGSHQGARNIAIMYSLLGSCKLNGLDPYEYLMAVLKKLPDYPISKISDLLPCHVRFEKPTTLVYKRV